jgi:hypothetical protein
MRTHFYILKPKNLQQGLFCHIGGFVILLLGLWLSELEIFYAKMLSCTAADEKRNVHREVVAAKEIQQHGARPCACGR